ncbi:MAG TPA: DegT/DnrJ/EryC1/StrS family aminotransferase [Deltaproteobacteria bacterium]|nr:DegT/DnrJ/EryC1/StrS family aminotransferase [Deltaproteobacteria bacterium]
MSKETKTTYVTQPALPPLEEFVESLKTIWESRILTNKGPFHKRFEKELADYLGVKFISLTANGTLALVTALQALRITGEVITTPYSFVATTHSLWWNNIKPVFVDIDPETCNLDPGRIEAAITPHTTAILPVHVYGNPCDVNQIQEIAGIYGLKVIYDACHTFGVTMDGVPVLNFGDLSVMSFHATKTFSTFEGGAIVCHDEAMKKRIDFLINFGFAGETTVVAPGINSKMNEVQAAMGLLQLRHIDGYLARRRQIVSLYRERLTKVPGLRMMQDMPGVKHCYTYFPVFVNEGEYGMSRDALYEKLKQNGIYCRRYFYPLISQFPMYRGLESAQPGRLPAAEKATGEVLCLPVYPDLTDATVEHIVELLQRDRT